MQVIINKNCRGYCWINKIFPDGKKTNWNVQKIIITPQTKQKIRFVTTNFAFEM